MSTQTDTFDDEEITAALTRASILSRRILDEQPSRSASPRSPHTTNTASSSSSESQKRTTHIHSSRFFARSHIYRSHALLFPLVSIESSSMQFISIFRRTASPTSVIVCLNLVVEPSSNAERKQDASKAERGARSLSPEQVLSVLVKIRQEMLDSNKKPFPNEIHPTSKQRNAYGVSSLNSVDMLKQ